jgi:hypothetical protein
VSLINDALRRAEAEKRPANTATSVPPLQPVEARPSATSPILIGGVLLLGVGAIGIAAALWLKRPESTTSVAESSPGTFQAPTAASPTPASQIISSAEVTPAQTPVTPSPAQVQPPASTTVAATPAAQPVNIASPPEAAGPSKQPAVSQESASRSSPPASSTATDEPLRLQSIFFRLRAPTVIINGKTVGIGGTVDGARVVSIQRSSVEIVQNGRYRTLTLQN